MEAAVRYVATLLVALIASGSVVAAPVIRIESDTNLAVALDHLRDAGLPVVYSTELVAGDLRVVRSAANADLVVLARELLEPHALDLRPLGSGLVGVVRSRGGRRWIVSGLVRDATNNLPIDRARVVLVEGGYTVWTDAAGGFAMRLSGREVGTLEVQAAGYGDYSRRVSFSRDAAAPVDIALDIEPVELDQVTVIASRYTSSDVEASSVFGLDRDDIIAQPKLAEDALQATARLPGIAFSGVSARPNVRGGESGEVLVRLDGMPIREPYHLPDYNSAFSALDDALVERLDAYTGPLPARHGNRLAGLVELQSMAPRAAMPSEIGVSTFNARLRHGHAAEETESLEWLANARVGTLRSWIRDYSPDVGLPSYGDAFLKFGAQSDSREWRASVLWSKSALDFFDADTTESAALDSETAYLWLTLRQEIGDALTLTGLLGRSQIDSDRRGSLASGLTPTGFISDLRRNEIWDAELHANWRASERHRIDFGFALTRGRGQYDYRSEAEFDPVATSLFGAPQDRRSDSTLRATRNSLGVYVSDRWQLHDRLFVESGVRVDRDLTGPARKRSYFSPRIAARFDVSDRTILRVSWGRAFQSDEVHELRVEDGVREFAPAQRVDQWVVSAEHQPIAGLALRLEAFRRDMPDPRTRFENLLDPLRFIPELSSDRVTVAPSSAELQGLEASVQLRHGAWSVWGAYTLATASDEIDGRRVPRDWDQRHTAVAAIAWVRPPWSLAALTTFHSGRPTTPVIDDRLESPALGERNSKRLSAYVTLDLRVEREWALARGRLAAFAQLTNALNRANRCCTEIDLPDEDSDRSSLEFESIRTYPVFPALGVHWAF
jgi:outer membrane receptor protein involved in Fe transport